MLKLLLNKVTMLVLLPLVAVLVLVNYFSPGILQNLTNKFSDDTVKGATSLTDTELKAAGLYNVISFGADPTGENDSTEAIQDAIDASYRQTRRGDPERGAVFFPSGQYLISDTLNGATDRTRARIHGVMLIGSTKGAKPQIILKNGAFNNNKPADDMSIDGKKAMLHIFACEGPLENSAEAGAGCIPNYTTQRAMVNKIDGGKVMQMSSGIMNLEFVIGDNNPDAIGIRFAGAQNNVVSNVKITAKGDSFAGYYSMTGTDTVVQDLEITGGKIGIHAGSPEFPTFSNVRLKDQSRYAISGIRAGGPFSLNGFVIEKETAPVISDGAISFSYSTATNAGGAYALSDGVIKVRTASDKAVIENTQNKQFSMQNVYFHNAPVVMSWKDGNMQGSAQGWTHVPLYAKVMDAFLTNTGARLDNGVVKQTDYAPAPLLGVAEPNEAYLLARHAVPRADLPSPDVIMENARSGVSGYVDVTLKGITPLRNTAELTMDSVDHQPALQAILDDPATKYVLLPRGVYLVGSPLEVNRNVHLFGVSNYLSEVRAHPKLGADGAQTYVITTENSADATPVFANFKVTSAPEPNKPVGLLHVRSGNTTVYGVMFRGSPYLKGKLHTFKPRNKMLISDNGGGRFYGIGTGGAGDTTQWYPGFRGVRVMNTTKPITFYALNPEDGGYVCPTGKSTIKDGCRPNEASKQVEVNGARNVAFRGWKCEDYHSLFVTNSTNVFANGGGGCLDWIFDNVNQALVLNLATKFNNTSPRGTTEGNKSMYTEKFAGSSTIEFKMRQALAMSQRGEMPNFKVWDYAAKDTPEDKHDEEEPTASDCTNTANLVKNGGFCGKVGSGLPSPWTSYRDIVAFKLVDSSGAGFYNVRNSGTALEATLGANTAKIPFPYRLTQDALALLPNKTYELSFYAKSSMGSDIRASIRDMEQSSTLYAKDYVANVDNTWKKYSYSFTPTLTKNDNTVRLYMFFDSAKVGEKFYVDRVVLKQR